MDKPDETQVDHRSAAEIEAEAQAAKLAADARDRDNPTGDADEDAFLRAFRTALAAAAQDETVKGAIVLDSPTLGEIWIDFHDANAKHVVVSSVRIDGEEVPLSGNGKAALLEIVREERGAAALEARAKDKAARLKALAAKATGENS